MNARTATAWLALLLVTALAGVFRWFELGLKPLHFDEGVNGRTIVQLLDVGEYAYKPDRHHGPLLFYVNAIGVSWLGRDAVGVRAMNVVFGTAALLLLPLFRPWLGWVGVLIVAAFVGAAPVEVYFSRTGIHEIYNLFFNLALVGGALTWLRRGAAWAFCLAAVAAACLFATKETTAITVVAMGAAVGVAGLAGRGERPVVGSPRALVAGVCAAVVVWAAFFSSFGHNPGGLLAFFEAFFKWGKNGTELSGHEKVWSYFMTELLWPYYRPALLLGAAGLAIGAWRRERPAIFLTVWFVACLAIYSVIPYKTPWCVISFATPLFLGVGRLARSPAGAAVGIVGLLPWLVPGLPGGALLAPRGDSLTINLSEYDVVGHPFVYSQPVREAQRLVDDLRGLYAASPPEHPRLLELKNPLRYLMPELPADTFEELSAEERADLTRFDVFAIPTTSSPQVQDALASGYQWRRYHDRPGRTIDLFVRADRWAALEAAAAAGAVPPISAPFPRETVSMRRTRELAAP